MSVTTEQTAKAIEQRGLLAVRQMTAVGTDLQVESVSPLTLVHRPTGEEFMVELKVLPMGNADG